MTKTTGVVLVGLGATGIAIAESLVHRRDCPLLGALDIGADKVGVPLADFVAGAPGVRVVSSVAELPPADVAVVATSSWIDAIEPTVSALVERGMNVVSICEELRDPTRSHADAVARLDRLAREHGVSVLGTGCNPGMLMDTLPLVLSGLTLGVERVSVRRTADMRRDASWVTSASLRASPPWPEAWSGTSTRSRSTPSSGTSSRTRNARGSTSSSPRAP
jgi:4-hydroxy-tetrahydrodipicolinate reductase